MKLSADQIRSVCMGASRVEETENGVRFLRFTKEQAELYKVTNADFYNHNHRPCVCASVPVVFFVQKVV